MESVREIMLIDADNHHAELYRRENDRWSIQLVRGAEATLSLASIDLRIPMAELYEGIAIPTVTLGS
jgi:Uma2 family endonuclease